MLFIFYLHLQHTQTLGMSTIFFRPESKTLDFQNLSIQGPDPIQKEGGGNSTSKVLFCVVVFFLKQNYPNMTPLIWLVAHGLNKMEISIHALSLFWGCKSVFQVVLLNAARIASCRCTVLAFHIKIFPYWRHDH